MSYGVYETKYGIEVIPEWEKEKHSGGLSCGCEPKLKEPAVIVHKPIGS